MVDSFPQNSSHSTLKTLLRRSTIFSPRNMLTVCLRNRFTSGRPDPSILQGELLWAAANLGQVEIVKTLIPLSDPQYFENALMAALVMGRETCSDVLLQHIEEQPNSALWLACDLGHIEQVHMLLPHCDIHNTICVLDLAVRTSNQELFDQVFALSDTDDWKRKLEGSKEQRDILRTNFQSMHENYMLREHIVAPHDNGTVAKRKM